MFSQRAPAGWYPQPDGTQRYWDGWQWTNHIEPLPTTHQNTPPTLRSRVRLIVTVALVSGVISGVGGWELSRALMDEPADQMQASKQIASQFPVGGPVDVPSADLADAATGYLGYGALSEAMLVDLLKEDGYPLSEIESRLEDLDVDWDEQAVKAAEEALESAPHSRNSLRAILEGSDFTFDQIEYALDNSGIDWKQNAVDRAEDIMGYIDADQDKLAEILENEYGFTPKEAQHGAKKVDP